MNDYDGEQAKELRRARLLKIKPKAAPVMLTESEFNREFVEYRFVSIEHAASLEESNNIMFCPACVKDVNNVMRKVRVLHISYEDDVLGNYPLIAVAKCQGCAWEEMIPVVKQELTEDERTLLRRFNNAQARSLKTGPQGSILDPGVWRNEMMRYAKDDMVLSKLAPSKIEFTPQDVIRFGQAKATRVWDSLASTERDRREVEMAKQQIDVIEHIEAEQRAAAQNRTAAKAAMMGQMYGAGPTRMADIARQYQNMAGQQMASQIDKYMMDQMMNMSFTHDEVTALKKEPAEAAKAAHQVLLDKVKQAFKK